MVKNLHCRITDLDTMHGLKRLWRFHWCFKLYSDQLGLLNSFNNTAVGSREGGENQLENTFTSFQKAKSLLHHLHLVIAAGETRKIRWWIEQRAGETGITLALDYLTLRSDSNNSVVVTANSTVSACLLLLSCNEQEMGHKASTLNLFTAHWVYHYDKHHRSFLFGWIEIY